jgi:hypothetical protein
MHKEIVVKGALSYATNELFVCTPSLSPSILLVPLPCNAIYLSSKKSKEHYQSGCKALATVVEHGRGYFVQMPFELLAWRIPVHTRHKKKHQHRHLKKMPYDLFYHQEHTPSWK